MASDGPLKSLFDKMSKGSAVSEAVRDGDAEETRANKGLSVERINKEKIKLEHILNSPDTYIGSVEPVTDVMWVYDQDAGMIQKKITYVPGLYKIFDEILINAANNKVRDPKMNTLAVDIDPMKNIIKISNNGKGIPIIELKEEKMYVPSMIFGHLLTSSNYNDQEKLTGGRYSYGVKLCNIYSISFEVQTISKEEQRKFTQTWTANMSRAGTPEIVSHSETDFTQITFSPDLSKFNMDSLDRDTVGLLSRRAFDVAASIKNVKFLLNGKPLLKMNFRAYIGHCLKVKEEKNKKIKLKCIPKLEDANHAGTRNSIDCTLILTAGDSGKSVAVSGLEKVGRDKYGVFPLERKLLNVREATQKQILENAEINNLIKILGLQYGKKYESVEDLKSLRYGRLMIMADQDPDGSHFKGLIINFLHHSWPSLLRLPFLEQFITPIVIAKPKTTKDTGEMAELLSFYSLPEFEEWKTNMDNLTNYNIKFYKALGTLTEEESKNYFSNLQRHRIVFHHDGDQDDHAILMAFSNKYVEQRRDWLNNWKKRCQQLRKLRCPELHLYGKDTRQVSYRDFVQQELIHFSNMENEHCIPSLMDGLKLGQRKVLFTCIKRNDKEEINVAQLACSVAEHSAYCQPASLMVTIIGLAQDFVGINNINLLLPNGQFGTRLHGGKDAASPHFISTKMSKLTRLIFHPKDDSLLQHRMDGNQRIEPEHYAPIVPMILVNGTDGISTGWMPKILKYNPRDIIENLKRMLNDEEPIPMNPWFKGFKGTIQKKDANKFVISGELAVLSATEIEITELPLGTSTQNYKEFVMENLLHGSAEIPALITNYEEFHTVSTVRFVVTMTEQKMQQAEAEGLHKVFKLQSTYCLTSMVLLDANGCVKLYNSVEDILKEFFNVRFGLYEKRKEYLSCFVQAKSKKFLNEARFIREVCDKVMIVHSKKDEVLAEELRQKNYDPDPILAWKQKNIKKNVDVKIANIGDYNYLLLLLKPPNSLTQRIREKEKFLKIRDISMNECDTYLKKSSTEFWREDLAALLVELNEVDDSEEKEMPLIAEFAPALKGRRIDPTIELCQRIVPKDANQKVPPVKGKKKEGEETKADRPAEPGKAPKTAGAKAAKPAASKTKPKTSSFKKSR